MQSNNMRELELGWRYLIPALLLLFAQVGLYVWMAPRGFDFTDEAFYFLNYLYWREQIGVITYFGAYFELPFRLFDESVSAMRILSLGLLLASAAYFARQTHLHHARLNGDGRDGTSAFVLSSMAAAMFYFEHLHTLRAPSYNLLALCAMLAATGILLRSMARSEQDGMDRRAVFIYGFFIGVCALGKASTCLLTLTLHALYYASSRPTLQWRTVREFSAWFLAGTLVNFSLLQYAHPSWLTVLREGVTLAHLTDGRSLVSLFNALRWEIQGNALVLSLWAGGIAGSFFILLRLAGGHPWTRSALAIMLVGGVAATFIGGTYRWWLPVAALALTLLWSLEGQIRASWRWSRHDFRDFALMALLLTLPIAFSYGTNMNAWEHSRMAAVFAVAALILRLFRLRRLGLLARPALAACLAILCLPTLATQVRAWTNVNYTYRQLTALSEQYLPVQVGSPGNTLLLDVTTRDTLHALTAAAREHGLPHGQAILDFTGDGPGIIYALGGRPLGLAWLLGGYPGSEAAAHHLLERLPRNDLAQAWLLSSEDNPRAIHTWRHALATHLGADSHVMVASVQYRAPYRWGKQSPDRRSLQIWKPRSTKPDGLYAVSSGN